MILRPLSCFAITLALAMTNSGAALADFYQYQFSGVIPDGFSNHSLVADGEVWTATLIIDSNTADVNPDPKFGVYEGAVVSGTLEFSGGYTPVVDFSGATAFALDDVFAPADADVVSIRGEFNDSNFVFQANTTDLATLDSDELAGPGLSFDSFPSNADLEYFVFTYGDQFGSIEYFGDTANNASFVATAVVPEPSGFTMLALLGVMFSGRRSRCQ